MREIAALIQLLAMGQIHQFALPDGRKYSVGVECYDYRSGEHFCSVLAWMPGSDGKEVTLGQLDFNIWRETVHIRNTEVRSEYKRMGVGRNMMRVLQQEGYPIDPGYTSPEGTPFLEQLRRENPDWFVQPDESEDA